MGKFSLKKRLLKVLLNHLLKPEDVGWYVNHYGELGVKIGDRHFFMYKGRSLEYKKQMRVRRIGKREFGEVCYPPRWDGIGYYADELKPGGLPLEEEDKWHDT
jgi:hypothetical protein